MAKLFKETVDREISRDNYHYPILPQNHMSKHIVLPSLAPFSFPEYPRMTSDNEQHPYTIWETLIEAHFLWKTNLFYGKSLLIPYLKIILLYSALGSHGSRICGSTFQIVQEYWNPWTSQRGDFMACKAIRSLVITDCALNTLCYLVEMVIPQCRCSYGNQFPITYMFSILWK